MVKQIVNGVLFLVVITFGVVFIHGVNHALSHYWDLPPRELVVKYIFCPSESATIDECEHLGGLIKTISNEEN